MTDTEPRAAPEPNILPDALKLRIFDVLLAVSQQENAARQADDALQADRCYALRSDLLDQMAQVDLAACSADLSDLPVTSDPLDMAERLLVALRAS